MVSLYFLHYNFCRIHKTIRRTPAMEAGFTDTLYDMEWFGGADERGRVWFGRHPQVCQMIHGKAVSD